MFGSKKPERPKRNHSGKNLGQYGLFDVPSSFDDPADAGIDMDADDSDLEAELLALTKDGEATKPKRPPRRVAPAYNLDGMVAESMKDIPSDEEMSGEEDDPDLLSELKNIVGSDEDDEPEPVTESLKACITNSSQVLEDRMKMYEAAEKNAKTAGESVRARRFARGLKTIKDLLKQANAGKAINEEDIPPEVTVNIQKHETEPEPAESQPLEPPVDPPQSIPEQPEVPQSREPETETVELLNVLNGRKNEYKMAALAAKKLGDQTTAISCIKIAKQFDAVIAAVEAGQPVDLSGMPGPPTVSHAAPHPPLPVVEHSTVQKQSEENPGMDTETLEQDALEENLITATSIAEALQQRLDVYKQQQQAAQEQGNSSKARRMGRIVKQYEDAIKSDKAGKPIAVDELPTPPGFAPIPVEGAAPIPPQPTRDAPPLPPKPDESGPPKPSPTRTASRSGIDNAKITTHAGRQLVLLLARQKEFKQAALHAKQKGEIAEAKEFLKTAKGFDPLINAAQGGLPVDISSLPVPPSAKSQLDNEYEIIMAEEVIETDPEQLDIISRLEAQLTKQLKLCLSTRDHNKAIGDVAGMNRFEQLALTVTRDLDIVRLARRMSSSVPKFHYETKDFSIVKSFTDLNDNDLELTVIRGVNYSCTNPKDVDTYVRCEFPYPQEEPVINKTTVVKDTNNPEYNETFVIPIQRKVRQCLRVFKRHGIKCEVYSRGGFFRSDSLIGTATIKLQPLETQCEIHDSFELTEGKKKVGGKLEVRIRVRDPMLTRQVEQLSEKWLVLDH